MNFSHEVTKLTSAFGIYETPHGKHPPSLISPTMAGSGGWAEDIGCQSNAPILLLILYFYCCP